MNKINELISKMTLEEKAALCVGETDWSTTPIERLGIPRLTVSDGPHGVRKVIKRPGFDDTSYPATCFPTASCTASSWDVELIRQMGQALAEECISMGIDVVLGPGTNMKRSPLCGRNFEYFSEDPYLAGQMAGSYINGVQSKGVGTSLKHFAVNNQEYKRLTISAQVDERSLREIYLPAFEAVVKQARPWTVMCAYNKINGTLGSENHYLLSEILKEEWGFEGFVVSDWGAVRDRVASMNGGLDLEMPGPRPWQVDRLVEAVRNGAVAEAQLDEAVRRILTIVFKAAETPKGAAFDQKAHHALARRIASEGMVLLKNNGILPMKNPKQIAVIGRSAHEAYFQGGGSSHINPTQVDNPYEELQKIAGEVKLSYARGYPDDDTFDQAMIDEACANARSADTALLYICLPTYKECEGFDRVDLDLTAHQVALIKAVCAAQPNSVVILNNGAPLVMSEWIDGAAAVLEAWMMGQAGGGAIADILFGKVNPSGRLAETYPLRLSDTPAFLNFPGSNGEVRYGESLYIGYRYYDAKNEPVQFPFGHGLSYTSFEYSNARVSAHEFKDVDGLTISVDVTNTGKLAGKDVVQVYVHDHSSALPRPPKELKAFAKVALQPGETKTVSLRLDFRAFAFYNPAYRRWVTEDGEFDILIGASSADIRCKQTVTLQSTVQLPSLLDRASSVSEWLEDERGRRILTEYVHGQPADFQAAFGELGAERIRIDMESFFMSLPLPSRLGFLNVDLPGTPDKIVDELLSKLNGVTG